MRPRHKAAEIEPCPDILDQPQPASMRPRHKAAEIVEAQDLDELIEIGFNEAAA